MDYLDTEWFIYYDKHDDAIEPKNRILELFQNSPSAVVIIKKSVFGKWMIFVKLPGLINEQTFQSFNDSIKEITGDNYDGWCCKQT